MITRLTFPTSDDLAPLRRSWWRRRGVLPIAVGIASASVGWFRLTPTARGTFWAEDGTLFLHDALNTRLPFGSILEPYQGYLQLAPRTILEVVSLVLPPTAWAVGTTAVCVALTGAVAALVLVCSRSVLPGLPSRVVMASVTVLVPVAPIEVLGNAANIHSYLLWLAPWLLLARPNSVRRGLPLGFVALVVALSEVQIVLLVPLVLWQRRDRATWPVKASLLVGVGAQILVTLTHPRSSGGSVDVPSAVERYFSDALATPWLGTGRAIPIAVEHFGFRVMLAAGLPLLVALVVVLVRGARAQRVAVVALAWVSVMSWGSSFGVNGTALLSGIDFAGLSPATRHAVAPSMLAIACLVLAGAVGVRHRITGARVIVPLAAAILAVAALISFVPAQQLRAGGPVWADQVRVARSTCAESPDGRQISLSIAPQDWSVSLTCGDLS